MRTYKVLLREGRDAEEYTVERTYRSLIPPAPDRGPYLTQEGDTFVLDQPPEDGEPLYGWK